MISEVIREADELGHLLLSRGLKKVKDLQSLLWGERGACPRDEVTDVFDPWETKRGLLEVESDVRSAKALEYLSDVTEELRFGFAVYEYIVDVYFAYSKDKSVDDLVLHTALKVRASSFQSHSNPCPLVLTTSCPEGGEYS